MSNWVLTIQVLLGLVATILLIVAFIGLARSEGYGMVTLIFAIIAIVGMVKAGDIIASFGPGRAAATALTPGILTARAQMLEAAQALLLQAGALLALVEGIVRGRRARGL